MTRVRTAVPLPLIIAALAILTVVSVGAAVAGPLGKDDGSNPGPGVDRDEYAREVAADQARRKPQVAFLKEFSESGADVSTLIKVEIEAALPPPQSLAVLADLAEVVGVVEVIKVEYLASNLSDLPATTVHYRVVNGARGTVTSDEFAVTLAGGPYRMEDGSVVMLLLPYVNVEQVGDRSLALLSRDEARSLKPAAVGSIFRLSLDGTIASEPNAVRQGIAGVDAAVLLATVASR